jgi:hypothetical protein
MTTAGGGYNAREEEFLPVVHPGLELQAPHARR